MSNTTVEIVASVKVPVGLRALGVITTALAKEWPEIEMQKSGEFMEFFTEEDTSDDNNS